MIAKKIKPSITELAPLIVQSLDSGKDIKLTVTGYSMYPLLRDDTDNVIIEKSDSFRKYDVVLYKRQNGQYVLHRILCERNGSFVIAGDNETVKEYPVEHTDCIGKVKLFERGRHIFTPHTPWYMLYSRVWVWFFPFRRIMGKVLKLAAKMYKKLCK